MYKYTKLIYHETIYSEIYFGLYIKCIKLMIVIALSSVLHWCGKWLHYYYIQWWLFLYFFSYCFIVQCVSRCRSLLLLQWFTAMISPAMGVWSPWPWCSDISCNKEWANNELRILRKRSEGFGLDCQLMV